MRMFPALLAMWLLIVLLTGCGGGSKLDRIFPDQRLEYQRQREARENLELPPDLAGAGIFDDAFDIPTASGSATYSEYRGTRERRRPQASTSGEVLPAVAGTSLERDGDRIWLRVNEPPAAVWPRLIAFWRQQGILLVEQDATVGTMRTDWIENRAEIRSDFVTNVLRRVVDGLYATSTRDQFRVRMDSAGDSTEIYLTHRSMVERALRNTVGEDARTIWEPGPRDPDKEAIMLRRLMLFLGVAEREAERMLVRPTGRRATASQPATTAPPFARADGELIVPDSFRRTWRQVGLALDRAGFAVEDRDLSQGVYFVRYGDPDRPRERRRLAERLAFWRGRDTAEVQRYRIALTAQGEYTRVTILDADGQPDRSPTGTRILNLIAEQL